MDFIPSFLRAKPKKTLEDVITELPKGRSSYVDFETGLTSLAKELEFVKDEYHKELVPYIRKLLVLNSSLSLAVVDSVQLCNPGYDITFDKSVKGEEARLMRKHLNNVALSWGAGTPGIHGLINKLIYQVFIGGALSSEWIINDKMDGISFMGLIKPETISVAYNKRVKKYEYYQRISNNLKAFRSSKDPAFGDKVKLNPHTYNYYELINDLEEPQGIPPFLSVLEDLRTQKDITNSIAQVAGQFGLLGFLQLYLRKPGRKDGEGDEVYKKRLDDYLVKAKDSLKDGVRHGLMAGYKDDHEFDFTSVTKDAQGLAELWDINHRLVSNGLITSPGFMGGATGGSESHINIIFTKMLSQMQNIQQLIKPHMERGFWLELTLAGFKFEQVFLEFKESTITDSLKKAQAQEIKIRNSRILYADGQYSQEDYGNSVGIEKPDQKEPRVPIDPNKVQDGETDRKKKEADKDKSDRKSRDKSNPQPKRKDQDTKSR